MWSRACRGVFLIPRDKPLDLAGRIVSWGLN